MKKVISTVMLFLCLITNSQNKIYSGEKSYSSTPSFEFNQEANSFNHLDSYYEFLNLSVGKTNQGGIILLEKNNRINSKNGSFFDLTIETKIKGDLFLYLSDGSVIRCLDRKIRGYIDNTTSSIYYLTKSEVEKLKSSSIVKIVYNLEVGHEWLKEIKKFSASTRMNTTDEIDKLFSDY